MDTIISGELIENATLVSTFDYETLDQFYGKMPDAFYIIKVELEDGKPVDWKPVYVNDELSKIIGCSKEEIMTRGFRGLFGQRTNPVWMKQAYEAAYEGKESTIEDHSFGMYKYIKIKAYQYAYGYAACVLKDETYTRLLNNTIHSSFAVYREIFFVHLEANYYRKVYPNGEDTSEFGDYTEAINRHFLQGIIVDEDEDMIKEFLSASNVMKQLKDKDLYERRYKRRTVSGETEWCLVSFTIGERVCGKAITATLSIRSIESMVKEEHEYNNKLKDALESAENASKAKTNFYSTVSHDMRTPLNAIIGMCTIAKLYPDDMKRMKSCIEKIDISSRHLMTLINEVLDMAQIESGKLKITKEPFTITEMMDELYDMTKVMAFAKNLYVGYYKGNVIHKVVVGDEKKICQIITNIISNAVKYSYDDNEISLTFEEEPRITDGKIWFRFTIADNGIGMEEEFVEKIFEPFERIENEQTKKVCGTGLGMPIANEMVKAMGGRIIVNSKINVGSTIVVKIPFDVNECEKENKINDCKNTDVSQMAATQNVRKIKALVVEDNEMNAEIAFEILKRLGVDADIAENGRLAYETIRDKVSGYYDCVFMDMRMPVMDGIECAKLIRTIYDEKELPIFAMTANVFTDDIEKTRQAGMQEHIGKPINMTQVKNIIEKYFGEKQGI